MQSKQRLRKNVSVNSKDVKNVQLPVDIVSDMVVNLKSVKKRDVRIRQ